MTTKKTISSSILFLLFLCIASNTAVANEKIKKEEDITIISYGIYAHSPDNGKSWINPISDKVIKGLTTSPVHISSTRTIPAQYPLFFGFEYNIQNLEEQTAALTTEVTHPKIKQPDGSFTTQYQQTQKFLVIDGKITATNGYLLENKDEIQAGKWTFKIKLEGKTVITQSFTVIKK